MIKRNKLSLFLLAVVMMLSVYYINMPNDTSPDVETSTGTVSTRYPEYASYRLEILESREEDILELENVLASADADDNALKDAIIEMEKILELTRNEVKAEKDVVDLGYADCVVFNNDGYVTVKVLDIVIDEFTYHDVKMIMHDKFDNVYQVHLISTPTN